jgi:hypothetical protein
MIESLELIHSDEGLNKIQFRKKSINEENSQGMYKIYMISGSF